MNFLVVSAFLFEPNSGAAGSIRAIDLGLERLGHTVNEVWGVPSSNSRLYEELHGKSNRILSRAHWMLSKHPDTECVIISQPFACRTIRALRQKFPKTLFFNRTHGWEARGIELQNRFGWDPPQGIRRILRPISQQWMNRLCRLAAHHSHAVIAASSSDGDWIRSRYQLEDERVMVIPYGTDVASLPSAPCTEGSRPNTFVYAGNFLDRKGARVLEQVLPKIGMQHPNATIEFFIDAASISRVEASLRPTWKNRLKVTKWVSRNSLYEALARSRFLVLPTYFEGFGKVALESLALGCGVIGFREGFLQDLSSEACIVSPVGDTDGFAAALADAASGKFFGQELSAKAIAIGRQRTWDDVASDTAANIERFRERYRGKVGGSN